MRKEGRLASEEEQFRRERRKLILGGIAAVGSLGVLGAECGGRIISKFLAEEILELPKDGKENLRQAVNELPSSPIKDLLVGRVLEYYQHTPPFNIQRAGVEIKVHDSAVSVFSNEGRDLHGSATIRGKNLPASLGLTPTRPSTITIPYLGLVQDEEKSQFSKADIAKDDTPLVRVTYLGRAPIYEGLTPLIVVYNLPDYFIEDYPEAANWLNKLTYIKEACTLLLSDIYIEETIHKMRELGLSSKLEAKTSNGSIVQADALIQTIQVIANKRGRWLAAHDIASHLIAFKAMEKTPLPNYLTPTYLLDGSMEKVMSETKLMDFGSTATDILFRSLKVAINSPSARDLIHVGDLKQLY